MKLLANENFPLASVNFLRTKGHDVVGVGLEFNGYTDASVIELANLQNRTILTFDSDYGTLIFKHGMVPKNGVIFLRLFDYSPSDPGKIVHELISGNRYRFEQMFTVVNKDGIRQRSYQF